MVLEEAIIVCRECLVAMPVDDPDRPGILGSLSTWLWKRYQTNRSRADLEEAARAGTQAAKTISQDDPDRLGILSNILVVLSENYEATKGMDDLEEVISICAQLVEALSLDHLDRTNLLWELRDYLTKKYSRTRKLGDLEYAISVTTEAVQKEPPGSSDTPGALNNLAILLSDKYTHTKAPEDLEEAIRIAREALHATKLVHSRRATLLFNLSEMLVRKYDRTRGEDDLYEAILIGKESINETPSGDPERQRASRLTLYAHCLRRRYEASASLDDLDESIQYSYEAVKEAPPGHPSRSMALMSLSTGLSDRFERLLAVEDLKVAVDCSQEAVNQMELDGRNEPDILSTHGNMLGRKYSRTGDLEALGEAISVARQAVDTMPSGHGDRPRYLNNLAALLDKRYTRSKAKSDIDEAIQRGGEALERVPTDDPDRSAMLTNLGRWFLMKHEQTELVEDLDKAIQISREAVQTVFKVDRGFGFAHYILACAFETRYTKGEKAPEDLKYAIHHYTVAAQDENGPPLKRIKASKAVADLHLAQSDWTAAYKMLAAAVRLVPKVGIRALSWDDRQYVLRDFSGLSSLAACAALKVGKSASEALALLEAGRGVIASSVIDSRSSISDLKVVDPDLHQEYIDCRNAASLPLSTPVDKWSLADRVSTRNLDIRRLEHLEMKIREKTDLNTFGLPLAPIDLIRLANLDFIVSFNVTEYRSDAFLVASKNIMILPLPDLTLDNLKKLVEELGTLTTGGIETHPMRNKQLRKHLKWLWKVAVRPVLDALNLIHHLKPDPLPRLWWVMSGLVGQTPLHAAGYGWGEGSENTSSHVVSSYIPTFKALASSRKTASSTQKRQGHNIQIVAMPRTTGYDDLSTQDEVETILQSAPILGFQTVDVLETPDKTAVLESLRRSPTIHFACHGTTDPIDPSNSGLELRDGPDGRPEHLTVLEVADVFLPQARMVYLSACSTAKHEGADLRDEVLHIASAFQLVGFPHVLATLWVADDLAAVNMAGLFYCELAANSTRLGSNKGPGGGGGVAHAHHRAVQQLRSKVAGGVITWATFVHLGC